MATNWFRKRTWTKEDEHDFFVRLKQSRSRFHKAQYLRVQACELMETATELNLLAAVCLLQLLLAEYREPCEIALAHYLLGKCHERLGQLDDAVSAYRTALSQQRSYRKVLTNAHLALASLVAMNRRRAEYNEALNALAEWGQLGKFPAMDFEMCAARAMILADAGQRQDAVQSARLALNAALKTHSGYRYHAKLGLVGEQHAAILKRMQALLAG